METQVGENYSGALRPGLLDGKICKTIRQNYCTVKPCINFELIVHEFCLGEKGLQQLGASRKHPQVHEA
jgi:hypothetical protein